MACGSSLLAYTLKLSEGRPDFGALRRLHRGCRYRVSPDHSLGVIDSVSARGDGSFDPYFYGALVLSPSS